MERSGVKWSGEKRSGVQWSGAERSGGESKSMRVKETQARENARHANPTHRETDPEYQHIKKHQVDPRWPHNAT